jgi:hypothetical protein
MTRRHVSETLPTTSSTSLAFLSPVSDTNVRYLPLADIRSCAAHVRFWGYVAEKAVMSVIQPILSQLVTARANRCIGWAHSESARERSADRAFFAGKRPLVFRRAVIAAYEAAGAGAYSRCV